MEPNPKEWGDSTNEVFVGEPRTGIERLLEKIKWLEDCNASSLEVAKNLGLENYNLRAEKLKLEPRPVVAAVIRTVRGDYIIGQRMPGQWMSGKWCFVGGKVESGESLEEAVCREVIEEIGIRVQVEGLRHKAVEPYEHGTFLLHYFDCLMDDGQIPQLLECSNTASVSPQRLPEYDLLPVDIDIAKQIALQDRVEKLEAANRELQERMQRIIRDFEEALSLGGVRVHTADVIAVLKKFQEGK